MVISRLYYVSHNTISSASPLGQLGLSGQFGSSGTTASSASTVIAQPAPASTDNLYVFLGTFGQNTIQNFDPLVDKIQLSATEFSNFAAVQSHMQQEGSNTVISYDAHDTITLVGVAASSLHASNFEFTFGYVQ